MTLTNYWWLLIWGLCGGMLLKIAIPTQAEYILGKKRYVWSRMSAILLVIPYCIWGGYRRNIGDTEQYRKTFHAMGSGLSGFLTYYKGLAKDKFFYSLEYLIKTLVGDRPEIFFLIVATFQIIAVALLFRKYSCDYWFSMIVFIVSTDYISYVFNGMRQFLAVTIIYAATPLLLKKKYISMILVILLASRFHGSAMLMLPIVFILQGKAFNKKTLLCIVASIIALVFVGKFTTLLDSMLSETQYTNVVSDWQEWEDNGMNPIRALVYAVPSILSLIGLKYIKAENDPVINMAANASLLTTALAILAVGTSGIFIGRLPIYTSLYAYGIMLPWIINNAFEEKSAFFVKCSAVVAYIVFFYYQMHSTWGIL